MLSIATATEKESAILASDFADRLFIAWQSKNALPHFTKFMPKAIPSKADEVQYFFVQKRKQLDSISGYKAGLTSKAGQAKFSVTEAIAGVLFEKGKVTNKGIIKLKDFRKLMLETEIGFVLSQDIRNPLATIDDLKSNVRAVVPVIEMPDLSFSDLSNISGIDIIAANAVSSHYLVGGEIQMPLAFSINDINIGLRHGEALVNQGQGRDALGDQWQALLWLVNNRLNRGYTLNKNDLLITGALGKMIAAEIGFYRAEFGMLGELQFEVQN